METRGASLKTVVFFKGEGVYPSGFALGGRGSKGSYPASLGRTGKRLTLDMLGYDPPQLNAVRGQGV